MVYVGNSHWNTKVYAVVKTVTPKGFLRIATISRERQDEETQEAGSSLYEPRGEGYYDRKGYGSETIKIATKAEIEAVKAVWKAEEDEIAAKKALENKWAYLLNSGQITLQTVLDFIAIEEVSVGNESMPVMIPRSFETIKAQMQKLGFGSVAVSCSYFEIHGVKVQVQTYVDAVNMPSVIMSRTCGIKDRAPHFHLVVIGNEAYLIEGNTDTDKKLQNASRW